jgi:hypothetical protein
MSRLCGIDLNLPPREQVDTHTHWLNGVLDDAIAGCLEAIKRESN